jgi:HSP20 family protein
LVREYITPEGGEVREVGPVVYGYSMTVGPDGKPRVREFGNVKRSRFGFGGMSRKGTIMMSKDAFRVIVEPLSESRQP